MSTYSHNKPPLPENYTPSESCVVVGKGKKFYLHPGNTMLRNLVFSKLAEYSKANTKAGKSEIISDVVDSVNLRGAFVKRVGNGKWVYAEDRLCREKCSQTFRDSLHETYKSSSIAKKNKRRRDSDDAKFEVTPSPVSSMVVSQENKRMRLMDPAPVSVPTDDFDLWSKLDAPKKLFPMRRASMTTGNGDLVSLLMENLALPSLDEDSNPFEPTPLHQEEWHGSSSLFGTDCIPSFAGCFEDFPPINIESADSNGAWVGQEGNHRNLRNVAAAFAA